MTLVAQCVSVTYAPSLVTTVKKPVSLWCTILRTESLKKARLPDFYNDDETGLKGLSAVMDDHHRNMAITVEDIKQLRTIYAVHNSASH